MDKTQERTREIDAAVADIRAIEQRDGITRASLAKIRQRLIRLAAREQGAHCQGHRFFACALPRSSLKLEVCAAAVRPR